MSLKDLITDVATLASCGFLTQTTPKIAPALTIIHSFQWHQPSCWSVASPSPALRRNTARTIRCSAAGASLDRTGLGIKATGNQCLKVQEIWKSLTTSWAMLDKVKNYSTYYIPTCAASLQSFLFLHQLPTWRSFWYFPILASLSQAKAQFCSQFRQSPRSWRT